MKGLPGAKVRASKSRVNEHQYVIMGVNRTIEVTAKDELKRKNVPFTKVIRITSRATNQPTQLVRVFTESKEAHENALKNGITLGYQKFRCELPKETPNEVKQCYNCQQFDHIAKQCQNELSCNKCGESTLEKNVKRLRQSVATVGMHIHLATKGAKREPRRCKQKEMLEKMLKTHKFPLPEPKSTQKYKKSMRDATTLTNNGR